MDDQNPRYPDETARLSLAFALACCWLIAGAYLDSWVHNHVPELETFFTPWHAVLYTGFLAAAAVLLSSFVGNLRRGFAWRTAVPRGYGLSMIGLGLFFVGGVGDAFWHELFGIEVGVEGALSATHQLLDLATVLLVSGPMRAAWQRADRTERPPDAVGSWRTQLPLVLSLFVTLATLVLISQIAHPLTNPIGVSEVVETHDGHFHGRSDAQVLGVVSVMVQSALLMGIILLAIRRWGMALPLGTMTVLLTGTGLAILVMDDQYRFGPAVIVAGAVAELLYRWLRPTAARIWASRLFATGVPLVFYLLYVLTLMATDRIWWSVHTTTGAVAAGAATGLLLSLLVFPPQAPE